MPAERPHQRIHRALAAVGDREQLHVEAGAREAEADGDRRLARVERALELVRCHQHRPAAARWGQRLQGAAVRLITSLSMRSASPGLMPCSTAITRTKRGTYTDGRRRRTPRMVARATRSGPIAMRGWCQSGMRP